MLSNKKLLTLLGLCGVLASCSVDEIKVPEQELFARQFIKSYGIIDPSQDWSVAKRESVTVSVSGETDVRIIARHDGRNILLAHYQGVSGTQELKFDCPKQVDEVIVCSPAYVQKVPVGASVNIAAAAAAVGETSDPFANFGKDDLTGLTYTHGVYWSSDYIDPIVKVLPERDKTNINSTKMVADFSFVSDGKPFTIYPVYWQTSANDVLGVYWYENGVMKTRDIFDNNIAVGDQTYFNIYHRNQAITHTTSINHNAVDVPTTGSITVTFNRTIKKTGTHSASLTDGSTSYTLSEPVISANGKSVTYSYSGLPGGAVMTFTVEAGSFETTDLVLDKKTSGNSPILLNFTTVNNTPKWQKTEFNVPNPASKAGEFVLTFDRTVKLASGTPELTGGNNTAKIGSPAASGKTVTIPFTDAEYSTSYVLNIPEGYIVDDASGTPANMSGFSNTFQYPDEPKKELVYETVAHQTSFIFDSDKDFDGSGYLQNLTTYTSGINIIKETDAPLEVYFYYKDNGKPRFSNGISSLSFGTLPGTTTEVTFPYGIRTKGTKPDANTNSVDAFMNKYTDTGTSFVVIKPTKDMILTAYTFSQNSGKGTKDRCAQIWDFEAKAEVTAVSSAVGIETPEPIAGNYYKPATASFKLSAGKQYLVYNKDGEFRTAGFAYQVATGETPAGVRPYNEVRRAPARSGSRGLSDNIEGTNNGQVVDIYPDHLEENGFERSRAEKNSVAVRQGDEIITQGITFQLPKDVIFGFYIHNKNGAAQITGDGLTPKDYANFSMSDLNQSHPTSFFNRLDATRPESAYFANGWYTKVDNPASGKGPYHDELQTGGSGNNRTYLEVEEYRRYSTASTYEYEGMRYFSFEDWVDYDMNDIAFMVAPANKDVEIIEAEVDTNPYIFAVEDLGATDETDIDFNDVVFAVEHQAGHRSNKAYVTMLAAGGTLKAELFFNGVKIDGVSSDLNQSIVGGPYAGTQTRLEHVNNWFGESSTSKVQNVGAGNYKGFGNLTTVEITVPADFSIADNINTDTGALGFTVRVTRSDGKEVTEITRPQATGEAPQVIILPDTWHWPLERIPIHEAYPGGYTSEGDRLPSFQQWVNGGDGGNAGFKNLDWHKGPVDGKVMEHLWTGSDAARAAFRAL